MTQRRVTIQDVAREAGVSITTVSRFLNQQYGAMGDETKQRIKTVIESLDYHPNRLAQGLKGNRSKTISVVVVNIGYPFCVSVIRTLSDVLGAGGYHLMVSETGGVADREERILRNLAAHPVDGLVIQTNGVNNDIVDTMSRQMPVVFIDRQFSVPGATNIITNNAQATQSLTDQLFSQGYHNVLYVTEALEQISTRIERLRGYEKSCLEAGRQPWVMWVKRKDAASMRAVADTLKSMSPTGPFAVVTANGLIMLELYPLLRQLPFSVPDQMGIATFDEPDWASIATPPLTCVRQPTEAMGELAAKTLLRALRKRGDAPSGLSDSSQAGSRRRSANTLKVLNSTVLMAGSTARRVR